MHQKAAGSSADVIMLDLEDSVPLSQKVPARQQLVDSINNLDWGNKFLSIRINQPGGQFAHRDILEIIPRCGEKINSIVIPKVSSTADVYFIDKLLEGLETEFDIVNKIASIPTGSGGPFSGDVPKSTVIIEDIVKLPIPEKNIQ